MRSGLPKLACGCRMFFGGRETLWKEKLGLVPKFAGNAATQWGTRQESEALLRCIFVSNC